MEGLLGKQPKCICKHEIQNGLPRTKHCLVQCGEDELTPREASFIVDNRKWPAIRLEEKLRELRGTYTVVDGKSEFAYGWRKCLEWIESEYNISPK